MIENRIERLADLFRQREQIDKKIAEELDEPQILITGTEEKPKRKYKKRAVKLPAKFVEMKGEKICPDCGRPHKLLIKGMCPSCYARHRKAEKKDIGTDKIKDVYRYECLDCEHKWTSFNDPTDEAVRDACPECESKMVKW